MSEPLSINNVPEVLRLCLHGPVTVVKDDHHIAAILSYFAELGGDIEQLHIDAISEKIRAQYELGSGTPEERTERFCRLVVHAVHSKTFLPLLVNGQPVAVVTPPLESDRSAEPSGPWIRITPV